MNYSLFQTITDPNPLLEYAEDILDEDELEEGDGLLVDFFYTNEVERRIYSLYVGRNTKRLCYHTLRWVTAHDSRRLMWQKINGKPYFYHNGERIQGCKKIRKENIPILVEKYWKGIDAVCNNVTARWNV